MIKGDRSAINSNIIRRYTERFRKYGVSKDTLGWHKGKQNLRYDALLRSFPDTISSICDVGCGFGDGIPIIYEKFGFIKYTGIDLVENFISECRSRYPDLTFLTGDYVDCLPECDAVIASGIFNQYTGQNYEEIESFIDCCKRSGARYISFDLLSSNVDFRTDYNHYSDFDKITKIITSFTRRFSISHIDQPFEYTVFIDFQDDFDANSSRYLDDEFMKDNLGE